MERFGYTQRMDALRGLESIVKEVGEQVLTQRGADIADTHDYLGHESSTIDIFAREKMQAAIDRYLPSFEGIIRTELEPWGKILVEAPVHHPRVLIIDEIDGTTNTKRCLTAALEYRPLAIVSVAFSLSGSLKDLVAGAVYTLDRGEVFSAFRVDRTEFLAFRDRVRIDPEEIVTVRGDSRKRVLVIGYSNSHRTQKGELEQVIYSSGLKTYEGCRSSGMDIINILRNSADAYIDLRHCWSTKDGKGKEKEAMLQVYDVAGVLPIALGCGLTITDAEGKSWGGYGLDDSIPLIVARPDIHKTIIKMTKPLVEEWRKRGKGSEK